MNKIKVLDCTLRDGGYVNNWNFGANSSLKIIRNLVASNIDYIEIGFLQNCEYDKNKTLFNDISQIEYILRDVESKQSKFVAMIVFGKFDLNKILPKTEHSKIKSIRVTFKKDQISEVFQYLEKIKSCGYELFCNPTNIETYTDIELLQLIDKINLLNPYGFSIVDTNGILKEQDIQRIFYLINHNLKNNIKLCFHSHNNLQLSFSNAQCLIKNSKNRELIIDSTVFGMGRGAGNLCTELLTQYLNDNYKFHYDLIPILKIIDEQINPIYTQTPWGYSVPYYLAATNHCHPNYAKYLIEKATVPVEMINMLLQSIPNEKKSIYSPDLVKQLYLDKFSSPIDDKRVLKQLSDLFKNKNILILAPGTTLDSEKQKINNFISKKNPYIISLNFTPKCYQSNLIFVTNKKRFDNLININTKLLITSNIENYPKSAMLLNYSSYLNNSKMFDNVALMLLKLLIIVGVKEVNIAGLDGFSNLQSENYIDKKLINNAKLDDIDERNKVMSEELLNFSKYINLCFITKTKYMK